MVKNFYFIVASFFFLLKQMHSVEVSNLLNLNLFKSRYCCGSVDDCDHITDVFGDASGVADESYIHPLVHCHVLGHGVDSLVSNALQV